MVMKKITGILSLLSIFILSLLTVSCAKYQLVSMSYQEFIQHDSLKNAVADVFVDDGINVYKLNHAEVSAESISGEPELLGRTGAGEKRFVKEKEKDKYIKGVTIFTRLPLEAQTAKSDGDRVYGKNQIVLGKNEIQHVKAYKSETALVIVLIIVGLSLLIVAGIVYLALSIASAASGSGSTGSGACYVATMVYGDYDAPEVMVLRNFRDNTLAKSAAGLIFIKVYYKYSPFWVERFRHSPIVNRVIKAVLDRLVKKLS
jgi:hypothetical protein